ncbi:MAG: hypothetical protein AB7S48_09640 [Bacteroidales bacterium]
MGRWKWEQGTGSREQGTGNREQGARNREQGTLIILQYSITPFLQTVSQPHSQFRSR